MVVSVAGLTFEFPLSSFRLLIICTRYDVRYTPCNAEYLLMSLFFLKPLPFAATGMILVAVGQSEAWGRRAHGRDGGD